MSRANTDSPAARTCRAAGRGAGGTSGNEGAETIAHASDARLEEVVEGLRVALGVAGIRRSEWFSIDCFLPHPRHRRFRGYDLESAARFAVELEDWQRAAQIARGGVYLSSSPLKRDGERKASTAEVSRGSQLYVDVDPCDGVDPAAGRKATAALANAIADEVQTRLEAEAETYGGELCDEVDRLELELAELDEDDELADELRHDLGCAQARLEAFDNWQSELTAADRRAHFRPVVLDSGRGHAVLLAHEDDVGVDLRKSLLEGLSRKYDTDLARVARVTYDSARHAVGRYDELEDAEQVAIAELYTGLVKLKGDAEFTAAGLESECCPAGRYAYDLLGDDQRAIHRALEELRPVNRRTRKPLTIGRVLARLAGRIVGGLALERTGRGKRGATYRIRRVGGPAGAPAS